MAYLYQYVDREPVRQAHPLPAAPARAPHQPHARPAPGAVAVLTLIAQGVAVTLTAYLALVLFLIIFGS